MKTGEEILREIDRRMDQCDPDDVLFDDYALTLYQSLKDFITAPSEKCEHNFKPICAHCGFEFKCEHEWVEISELHCLIYQCKKCKQFD